MLKIALSLILALTFTVSVGNCFEATCASGDSQITDSCSEKSAGHHAGAEGEDADSKDHKHCAFHCNHAPSASLPVTDLNLSIEIKGSMKASYLFAYTGPSLDSIERPPLFG